MPILIFVHGLTGNMNEHQFFNAARWFEKKGIATFRFNLYDDWMPRTRKLNECTLQTHARDIDLVTKFLQKHSSNKIHIAGHSYGGPSILLSHHPLFQSAILWDPTAVPIFQKLSPIIKNQIGKRMIEEDKTLNAPLLLDSFSVPTKIICAGKSSLKNSWRQAWKKYDYKQHAFCTIPGASHCFDEDGAEEKLFLETYQWIQKHKK